MATVNTNLLDLEQGQTDKRRIIGFAFAIDLKKKTFQCSKAEFLIFARSPLALEQISDTPYRPGPDLWQQMLSLLQSSKWGWKT